MISRLLHNLLRLGCLGYLVLGAPPEIPGPILPATLASAAPQSPADPHARQRLLPLAPRIVFVVRAQYPSDHHNTATMFQTGEINTGKFRGPGAVKLLDVATGRVTTLLEVPQGVARDLDVRYDGRRILFSMRRDRDDDYHVYEMHADGSGVRQLTFGSGVSDIDPAYLPDGRIVFSSTREPKYCMCNRHIMGNLFVMDADGANIQQIGHSTLHEGHPAVMPDGRILYDRWEYVDRNFGDAQGVWTVNPDGTNHAVCYGNNTNSPGAVLDARIIPGTEQMLCTFSSCHDRPWGALAIVDRRRGIDGRSPVVRTWPADAIELVGQGNYDTFKRVSPKYEDPYPLSERYFLCSRMTGQGEQMGLYLIDVQGEETLVYAEAPGCFDPLPLAPRPRPPAIPSRIDLRDAEGRFYVADVYRGSGMERVDRGSVHAIRVVESPEKRFWTQASWNGGTGTQAPAMAWDDFNNKRILGTAPVEADGSAYFRVPADTFVYFQLLDQHGMMVQSMRSGTIVRPGEHAGCVGCHEPRRSAVPPQGGTLALLRGPSPLEPWHGPPRLFSYTAEVQPVFDRHCVACHDYATEAGQQLNLAGDRGWVFNTSYVQLRGNGWVHVPGAGPWQTLPPLSWGSRASRLVQVLRDGHGDEAIDRQIRLSPEDFDRIVTWIDLNAPYYATYSSAYRGHPFGRAPLTVAETKRWEELTQEKLDPRRTTVSFTRPLLSPILSKLEGVSQSETLELLRTGQRRLADRPRADMPGYQLVDSTEIAQQTRYERRLRAEKEMRQAIIEGQRRFEESQ